MLFQKKDSRVFLLVSKFWSVKIVIALYIYIAFAITSCLFLCLLVTVQIGLHTTFQTRGISWTLGPNCASQSEIAYSVESNAYYESKCTLALGQSYTLSCKSFSGGGWNSTYLIIENTAYCENFRIGFEETANINITGTYNSLVEYLVTPLIF